MRPGRVRSGQVRIRLSPADLLLLGLHGVRTRPRRSALSALGIAIGIATMIIITGTSASNQAALDRDLTSLGTDMLRADPLPSQTPPVRLPADSVALARRIGPVTVAAAVANTHRTVYRSALIDQNDTSGLSVLAASGDLLAAVNGRMAEGEYLSPSTEAFPMAVLGYEAARALGIGHLGTGTARPRVLIARRHFTVIGILGPMPLAADLERSVLVGGPVARSLLGFNGRPTVVYVKAREGAIEDVRSVLAATLAPTVSGLVTVSRPSDALAAKRVTTSALSALALAQIGVSLLVGAVGVANTMVISVLERRSEIGLRRSLGATRGHIRAQFLIEATTLSGLGGLAGTAVGLLAVVGYAVHRAAPVEVPLPAVAAGIGAALVVGAVAGLQPSIAASRLPPTEALSLH